MFDLDEFEKYVENGSDVKGFFDILSLSLCSVVNAFGQEGRDGLLEEVSKRVLDCSYFHIKLRLYCLRVIYENLGDDTFLIPSFAVELKVSPEGYSISTRKKFFNHIFSHILEGVELNKCSAAAMRFLFYE
jgi:hypothetical protein